jgi:phosphatidylethanolamine/phosphatidyl-N-methylethanolamine N-methyltransferase
MNKTSEKFYDRLTFFYPLIDLFLKPQKRKFFATINSYPHGRLLEIGIGNGSHLTYYTNHEITGVDTSKSMLARARKHQKNSVRLFHMNAEALRFPDEMFDYVILSHVIAVVEDPEKVLEEVYRVLKPNGRVFILNHFTPNNCLRHLDISFEKISRFLHFKSVFHITGIGKITSFTLLGEFNAGLFSYFKILIYEKNI